MKTKEIIIEKAREEFLEKGFQEAIFEAVVELAVKEWEAYRGLEKISWFLTFI